jgi:hypothetical protein
MPTTINVYDITAGGMYWLAEYGCERSRYRDRDRMFLSDGIGATIHIPPHRYGGGGYLPRPRYLGPFRDWDSDSGCSADSW